MPDTTRQQRLRADLESLRHLKQGSSLFDFEPHGDPPNRYLFTFRGKGISRGGGYEGLEYLDLHRCEVRLGYSYPERPPDIRWLTPLFHPNVSFIGHVDLKELGLPWTPDLTLDVLCERLWDVLRLAYMNLEGAANFTAAKWFEEQEEVSLPVDERPLRDRDAPAASNVVRYQRRREPTEAAPDGEGEVLYIDEDTPTPPLPQRSARPRRAPQRPTTPGDDDDVLYIG